MIKEFEKAKEGYEKVVVVFDELIANIEQAKADEIALIEEKYAERLNKYTADRANYVEVGYEEIPDEELETVTTDDSLDELAQMGDTTSEQFQNN